MKDIHKHVRDLNKRFESIQEKKKTNDICARFAMLPITLVIPGICMGVLSELLIAFGPVVIQETIGVLRKNGQISIENGEIKTDDYYLLWRINDPKKHK